MNICLSVAIDHGAGLTRDRHVTGAAEGGRTALPSSGAAASCVRIFGLFGAVFFFLISMFIVCDCCLFGD